MQIIYEYHNVSASQGLERTVKEKLDVLEKKYDFVHRADVFFKTENRTNNEEKICEIRLSMPGPRIFASTNAETFEATLADTIRDLNDQLEKRKQKMKNY